MKRRNFFGLCAGLLGAAFLPKIKAKPNPHISPAPCSFGPQMYVPELPIGHIPPPFVGMLPKGYLPCDGRAVSRLEYNKLFQVLDTTYGKGDGLTTFNIPDLTAQFIPNHWVEDPGHSHCVVDPPHNHYIKDPGHRHGLEMFGEYIIKAK